MNRQEIQARYNLNDDQLTPALAACGLPLLDEDYGEDTVTSRLSLVLQYAGEEQNFVTAAETFAREHHDMQIQTTSLGTLVNLMTTMGLTVQEYPLLLAAAAVEGERGSVTHIEVTRFAEACSLRSGGLDFKDIAAHFGGTAPSVAESATENIRSSGGQHVRAVLARGYEVGKALPEAFLQAVMEGANSPEARERAAAITAEFEAAFLGKGDLYDEYGLTLPPSQPLKRLQPESNNT